MVPKLSFLNYLPNQRPDTMQMFNIARPLNIISRRTKYRRSLIIMSRRTFSKNQVLRHVTQRVDVRRIRATRPPTMRRDFISVIFLNFRMEGIVSPPLIMNNRKVLMKDNQVNRVTIRSNFMFHNKIQRLINSRTGLRLNNL